MLDVNAIRDLFPTLKQKVNDCELIYLDNGATTHKPKIVLEILKSGEDDFLKTSISSF